MNTIAINGKTVLPLCINLLRSQDRKQSVQDQMQSVGVPMNFCHAIDRKYMVDDATGLPIDLHEVTLAAGDRIPGVITPIKIRYTDPSTNMVEVFQYIPPAMIRSKYVPYTSVLYLGTIGCSLSHLKCLKIFNDSGCDYALILEDDIDIISKDRGLLHSRLQTYLNEQFHFFLLGTGFHRDYVQNQNGYCNGDVYETAMQYYSGSSAYLISREGLNIIKPIVGDFRTVFSAADEFFGFCQVDLNCRILSTRNKVFRLHETLVQSTLNDYV